jgi:hypothetical protein
MLAVAPSRSGYRPRPTSQVVMTVAVTDCSAAQRVNDVLGVTVWRVAQLVDLVDGVTNWRTDHDVTWIPVVRRRTAQLVDDVFVTPTRVAQLVTDVFTIASRVDHVVTDVRGVTAARAAQLVALVFGVTV